MNKDRGLGADGGRRVAQYRCDAVTAGQRAAWTDANRDAFDAYDAAVEVHGVFSDGKRLF